jgi:hypothetical protein
MARNLVPVILSNGKTISAAADGKGQLLCGVYIPHGFSGTTLTFRANTPDGSRQSLVSDGAGGSYTRTVRADDYVPLDTNVFSGVDLIAFVSGTSQSGDCTLVAVFAT